MWDLFLFGLGVLSNAAWALACVPTAYKTVRAGKSVGTPIGLAWNIFIACWIFYIYITLKSGPILLVLSSGLTEIVCYGLILWYHYFPRRVA